MKLQPWMTFSLVALALIGCAGNEVSSEPLSASPIESPVTQTTESPVAQTTESPVAQTESPSPVAQVGEETVIKSGSFQSGEHPTQGTARIVSQEGRNVLELDEAFQTSTSGPDLFVILHRSDNVLGSTEPPIYPLTEGEYVVLAPLQAYSGAQSYAIPDDINLNEYQSAAIWCRQFNATFGAALLQ
ncbi:MAG: DM13 domain-containing protein [Cyanobacteria bacterium CRU_2_1]|nr:DM13 domain-containing protein [Cyanobacteria bacterium RU_5_0]NJR63831.1 DM13 domain-containing protein [Cyanobacteria bacterium CRU_2_1]